MKIWRYYSTLLRRFLNVGASLQEGKKPPEAEMQLLYDWICEDGPPNWGMYNERSTDGLSTIEDNRAWYLFFLNALLIVAGVRPNLVWENGDVKMQFTEEGLFNGLVALLAFAVSRSHGLATCTACGMPYLPRKQPSKGKRNYCPSCGRHAAMRDASREYRRRKKQQRTTATS